MSPWEVLSKAVRILLVMSAAGGSIALVLFILKPILKNRIPKTAQYYLWVLVLAAFLVPFSAFVSLPFLAPMAPLREAVDKNVKTTSEQREDMAQEQYGTAYDALDAQEKIEISYDRIGLVRGSVRDHIMASLVSVGGVIFVIELLQYAVYVSKLRGKRLSARSDETALLRALCKGGRRPRLYRNPLTSTPMLIGVFRPVIYLPDREYSGR